MSDAFLTRKSGSSFEITNAKEVQYAAVGEDIEKYTFVETAETGPIISQLLDLYSFDSTINIFHENDNTVLLIRYDGSSAYFCALRNNRGNIVASNWVEVLSSNPAEFVGELDNNKYVIKSVSEGGYNHILTVLSLSGQTLSAGTSLSINADETNFIISSSSIVGFLAHNSGYSDPAYVEAIPYSVNGTTITAGTKKTVFTESGTTYDNLEVLYTYPTEGNGGTALISTYHTTSDKRFNAVHVTLSGTSLTKGTALLLGAGYYVLSTTLRLDGNSFIFVDDDTHYCHAVIAVGNVLYRSSLNIPEYAYYPYNVSDGISLILTRSSSNYIYTNLIVRSGNAANIVEAKSLDIGGTGLYIDKVIPFEGNKHRIFYRITGHCAAADITVTSTTVTALRHRQTTQALINLEFIGETNKIAVYSDTRAGYIVYITNDPSDIVIFREANSYPPPSQEDHRTCLVYSKNCLWTVYGDYVQGKNYYLIFSSNLNTKSKMYSANYVADTTHSSTGPTILMAIPTEGGMQFASLDTFMSDEYKVTARGFVADDNGNVLVPGTGVKKSKTKIEGLTKEKIFQGILGTVLMLDKSK